MLASAVPFGIIEGLLGLPGHEPRVLILAEGVVINFIFFYWFMVDSQIRNYDASGFQKFLVVVFGPIALSWYVLRTRDSLESIRAIGYALGLLIVSVGVLGIIGLATSALVWRGGLQ